MSSGETEPRGGEERLRPSELPAYLAHVLKDVDYALLMQATEQGTAFVEKAPAEDIQSMQGAIRIGVRHELYRHPRAPVLRTVLTIIDQPDRPLVLETFTNIAEPDQRSDFARLAEQDELLLLLYDEILSHRLTKRIPGQDRMIIMQALETADALRSTIPAERYDFDQAKADVMGVTKL